MTDREKVIKGLECCITDGRDSCKKCYQEGPGFGIACRQGLMRDALELLKVRKPVKPYLDFDGKDVWTCGNCDKHLFHPSYTQCDDDEKAFHKYCGYCGRAVKWYD